MGSLLSPSAQKDKKAEALMKKQKLEEQNILDEEKSDLAKRKIVASKGGRRQLMTGTATGLATKVGGTV